MSTSTKNVATTLIDQRPAVLYVDRGKRIVDLTIAILLLPSVLPIIAVLYVIIRRDGGASFFGHMRIGRDGKPFRCMKLRTMVPDAESALEIYLEANPEMRVVWERDYKLPQDPRVTRIGKFLRATSLDELPQLWNVLKGDMSLVGPRPVPMDELTKYGQAKSFYTRVRPGITGLWQVSGRNDLTYEERVNLDVSYVKSHTLAGDLGILFRTVGAVLQKTGK
jgi:lipopolysaccharide/colanic/teichoic acid biosynthesis glycosyltransferase